MSTRERYSGPGPGYSKTGYRYSLDKSLSRAANAFRLMLLVRLLHRPIIHVLLPSLCDKFHMATASFSYRCISSTG